MKPKSVKDWLRREAGRLAQAGVEQPWLDAEILLGRVLGDRQAALKQPELEMCDADAASFEELVERRSRREPLAYITGEKEFWSLSFRVSPAVLIPRPETETLVEAALACTGVGATHASPLLFADVGCGCGCIAAALAHELPRARGWAVDISPAACRLAEENLGRLDLSSRVTVVEADLLEPVPCPALDLVAANLPYIASETLGTLPAEVQYEPRVALDGGADGLDLIRLLARQAAGRLGPGGWLVLEISPEQAEAVSALCANSGFVEIDLRRDLAGNLRVAMARRPI